MHADDGIVLRLPDADLMGLDLLDQARPGASRAARSTTPSRPPSAPPTSPSTRARSTRSSPTRSAAPPCSPPGSASAPPAPCCCRAAAPASAPRCGSSASAPPNSSRWRASSARSRSSWRPSANASRTSSTCPASTELMGDIESRRVRLVEVTTPEPSPFARSLLFGYVAQFLYEGDSPLAERRAAALSLDSRLLAELLGQAELRELLDAEVLAELERELQWLTEDRRVKDAEGVADLLRAARPAHRRRAGRARRRAGSGPQELAAARRAIRVRIAGADHWAAIEDAGRLRDALGTALPVGVPEAFTEPVKDPLGDLLARYARTHGPFTSADGRRPLRPRHGRHRRRAAAAGRERAASSRASSTPRASARSGATPTVLRRLRRRSLAALRQELEPVPPAALAAFLPQWQHLRHGPRPARHRRTGARRRAAAGRARARLRPGEAGPARPGSRTTPRRCSTSSPPPARSCGPARARCPARTAGSPSTSPTRPRCCCPPPHPLELTALHQSVLDALAGGYGLFFRQIADQVRATTHPDATDPQLADALWDLAWSGRLTNDTLAPLRSLLGSGRTAGSTAHRAKRTVPRGRYGSLTGRPARPPPPARGPPTVAGRWSLLPAAEPDPTHRAHALARTLLDRHGVVTRGAVAAEGVEGGFSAAYRVLSAFEESGQARRGYVVEGLGAAQFAMDGAVDRLRAVSTPASAAARRLRTPAARRGAAARVVLAAADPANAYGAALPWPEPPDGRRPQAGPQGGLPGGPGRRRADALHGARRQDPAGLALRPRPDAGHRRTPACSTAAEALAAAARAGALGTVTVERVNGASALTSPFGHPPGSSRLPRHPARPPPARLTARGARPRGHPRPRHRPPDRPRTHPSRPPAPGIMDPCPKETPSGRPPSGCTPRWRARSLTRCDLRVPRLATADLTGRTVLDVTPRGKHLLTRIEGGLTLHSHLRMDGSWQVYATGRALERRPRPPDPRDPRHRRPHRRRLPPPRPRTPAHRRRARAVGHLGPDLLGPDWDPDEALRQPPRRPRPPPRRGPARPAQPRRHRQCLQVRAVLPARRHPLAPRRRTCPPTAPRSCPRSPRSSWKPTGPPGPHDHAPGRRGQRPVGLRPRPPPLPALRHPVRTADQGDGSRERPTYWCPTCQPDPPAPGPTTRPTPYTN